MKQNDVKESTEYDNYLNADSRMNDSYKTNLELFFGEEIETPIFDEKLLPKSKDHYKMIKVHFRNIQDHLDFCNATGQVIGYEQKSTYFPLESENKLFDDDPIKDININLLRPQKLTTQYVPEPERLEWTKHWKGMPEYRFTNNRPYKTVEVKIRSEKDVNEFAKLFDQKITEKTIYLWYPKGEKAVKTTKRWVGPVTTPRYPLYIVSKGRHESMFTSRTLADMKVHHYIIIEPQDHDRYVEALETFKINPFATLLVAPFSNHGDGPGRARNWAWDHSISLGFERHWVFDDNIKNFYRLHENARHRIMSSAIFNAMEDFVDRYENIYLAGPQYYFFCADSGRYPPYVLNTRIYSALLIKNDCKHRWRGRYNEDTDLSLRVLKDGDVTIQFNAFLQGKLGTQLLKGGNTEEFYHKEGVTDKEQWRGGNMNATGTINKSKMLVDMHPDVATLAWKYGRWHHYVDYSVFRNNRLILKPGVEIPKETDEYGLWFDDNFDLTKVQF